MFLLSPSFIQVNSSSLVQFNSILQRVTQTQISKICNEWCNLLLVAFHPLFVHKFVVPKLIAAADRRYLLMTPPETALINWQTALAPRTGTCFQSANGTCLVFPTPARRSLSLNDAFCPLFTPQAESHSGFHPCCKCV